MRLENEICRKHPKIMMKTCLRLFPTGPGLGRTEGVVGSGAHPVRLIKTLKASGCDSGGNNCVKHAAHTHTHTHTHTNTRARAFECRSASYLPPRNYSTTSRRKTYNVRPLFEVAPAYKRAYIF